mgnify:CR=1 FL=1|tara:strand:- start:738 stop:902 length:165 start_codon:yes stop_codon:yes gene_type:complete
MKKGLSNNSLKRKHNEVEGSDFLPDDYSKILFERRSPPKINQNITSKIKNFLKL